MLQLTTQISVIIVNYNSGQFAQACIESLLQQQAVNIEIIVVDNASQDNSVALLNKRFPTQINCIASPENLGFGCANNLATTVANGEFLLFLNPDTLLTSPFTLKTLLDFIQSNLKLGLVGPAIEEPRKGKKVLPRRNYPSAKHLNYTQKFEHLPGKIAWLLGACLLIPRHVFDTIDGFDPDFFLYGEDADIGLRIRLAGYQIGYCPNTIITHVSGASEIGADYLQKWLRKKRGLFLFCKKHFDARDAVKLANSTIFKSQLYLIAARFTGFFAVFFNKNDLAHLEKVQRLKASIIAAKELLEHY